MTERFSSLLPPVNVEEQPREECIACRPMELEVSVFRFTAQSRRKHTIYDFLLSSRSERVTVGFTGRWLQDIAFVFPLSTFPARRWTSDPEVILGWRRLMNTGSAIFLKDDFKNIFYGPFHLTVTCFCLFP